MLNPEGNLFNMLHISTNKKTRNQNKPFHFKGIKVEMQINAQML